MMKASILGNVLIVAAAKPFRLVILVSLRCCEFLHILAA